MSRIQQAGAIAFRAVEGSPRALIVRAKKNPRHWIFPKGHVEPGEDLETAAARELREEAGVVGEVIGPAGTLRFTSGDEAVEVHYFLVRARSETDADEERQPRWCSLEEAKGLLTFEDARALLSSVWSSIQGHLGGGTSESEGRTEL